MSLGGGFATPFLLSGGVMRRFFAVFFVSLFCVLFVFPSQVQAFTSLQSCMQSPSCSAMMREAGITAASANPGVVTTSSSVVVAAGNSFPTGFAALGAGVVTGVSLSGLRTIERISDSGITALRRRAQAGLYFTFVQTAIFDPTGRYFFNGALVEVPKGVTRNPELESFSSPVSGFPPTNHPWWKLTYVNPATGATQYDVGYPSMSTTGEVAVGFDGSGMVWSQGFPELRLVPVTDQNWDEIPQDLRRQIVERTLIDDPTVVATNPNIDEVHESVTPPYPLVNSSTSDPSSGLLS